MRPEAPRRAPEPGRAERDLRTVARQGSLQFAGSLLNAVLAFVLVVVATRALGRASAGAFLVSIGAFQVLATISVLGADVGLIRSIPRAIATGRGADVRPLLRVALLPVAVVGSALAIAAFVAAPALAEALSGREPAALLEPFLRTLAWFVPLAGLTSAALGGTRGLGTVRPSVTIELGAKPAARPLLLGLSVALGLGSVAIALSYALPILVGVVVVLAWLGRLADRVGPGQVPPAPIRSLARPFWAYAAPRGLHAVVTTTTLWIDVLLLSGLRSPAEAAVYTAATRFLVVGEAALHAVVAVISPQVSRLLAGGDRNGTASMYQTSTWWLMTMTWPLFLAIAVFAPLLLRVFGPGFEQGAVALSILALASLVAMATGPAGAVLLMAGHSMLGLVVGTSSLALNVVLNLVLIPELGMTGAAWAWAVSIVLANLAGAVLLRRLEAISPLSSGALVVGLASLATFGAIGVVVRAALGTGPGAFVLYLLAATAAYAAILRPHRERLRFRVLVGAVRARGPGAGREGPGYSM
jgi:O-antigen/teichoic acid export membrane protein